MLFTILSILLKIPFDRSVFLDYVNYLINGRINDELFI